MRVIATGKFAPVKPVTVRAVKLIMMPIEIGLGSASRFILSFTVPSHASASVAAAVSSAFASTGICQNIKANTLSTSVIAMEWVGACDHPFLRDAKRVGDRGQNARRLPLLPSAESQKFPTWLCLLCVHRGQFQLSSGHHTSFLYRLDVARHPFGIACIALCEAAVCTSFA
jgi:hypothetical protein